VVKPKANLRELAKEAQRLAAGRQLPPELVLEGESESDTEADVRRRHCERVHGGEACNCDPVPFVIVAGVA